MSLPSSWLRPFDHSADGKQLRQRALAAAALWLLLAGFLAAVGFAAVLLLSFALVLLGGLVAGALFLNRRYPLRRGSQTARRSLRTAASRLEELGLARRGRRLARAAAHRSRIIAAGGRGAVEAPFAPLRVPVSYRRRQALRLNERGARLRREGKHEQAAEEHRAALAIARDLGDRHTEGLTLNNLALALVHTTGGVPRAIQHFEQALVVLREVGDEEREGQVIANLGFVRRRQGRDEDAVGLLQAALDKLPPDSSAYHQVEAELRRAS